LKSDLENMEDSKIIKAFPPSSWTPSGHLCLNGIALSFNALFCSRCMGKGLSHNMTEDECREFNLKRKDAKTKKSFDSL